VKNQRKIKRMAWKVKSLLSLRDYWTMSDKDIVFIADSLSLIDMYDFGTTTHNDFETELTYEQRKLIIDELTKRDRHISSYTTVIISLVALGISMFTLIF